MHSFVTSADRAAIEAEAPWSEREVPATLYRLLSGTAARHGDRPAVSFQLTSGPSDPAETLSWAAYTARVTQAANLFRRLGVGEGDVVAYLLPNCSETAAVLIGGATAGIVAPVNPLLEPSQIAAILRETGAKVLVTLKPFPKTDIAARAAAAVAEAPDVETVLEVDLARYLRAPKRWLVPFLRPKRRARHRAGVQDFTSAAARERADALDFEETGTDRIAAYFHTGGTTGMPKLAQHAFAGMVYNGWLGREFLFSAEDTVICPLPLFHVFACHPVLMSVIAAGGHLVLPTPAGYRGEGVIDNFWKLVERWRGSFVITVPTAISALMQRRVDGDIGSLRFAVSGSSPLPVELYHRFEKATGVTLCEGYGLTEATCLVSINPPEGEKKIGSVGLALPYTDLRILRFAEDGVQDCANGEVGEICVASPGVIEGATFTDPARNRDLYAGGHVRTGDLGRLDEDGYLFITGRTKDLIIRGGHNIDPAQIEEALLAHPGVAFAGAIGQPDAARGELPCAYVELVTGATVTGADLVQWCRDHVPERAAVPKYIEVLDELPKTAIGKVFKPDLRRRAIARVYGEALRAAGHAAGVAEVVEDPGRGLVARLRATGEVDAAALGRTLGEYTRPWEWADAA